MAETGVPGEVAAAAVAAFTSSVCSLVPHLMISPSAYCMMNGLGDKIAGRTSSFFLTAVSSGVVVVPHVEASRRNTVCTRNPFPKLKQSYHAVCIQSRKVY